MEKPNLEHEKAFYQKGFKYVAGVDEAGRGPLISDVFAAAVILPPFFDAKGITDSKKLSEKKREELFYYITENALAYGIGSASSMEIDEMNIRNATFLAMKRAIDNLQRAVCNAGEFAEKIFDFNECHFLIDGNAFSGMDISYSTIIKGDAKSLSIAAASILAKVSRDREMRKLDEIYPQYGFAKHKGYGTRQHYEAIKEFGILPEHRKSFRLL